MRSARSWLALLVTALLLLAAGSAFGAPHYFCHMAGEVVDACCCASHQDDGSEQGSLSQEDCCERLSARPQVQVTPALRLVSDVPAAALLAIVPQPVRVPASVRVERPVLREQRGPPSTRPLFVKHRALLI